MVGAEALAVARLVVVELQRAKDKPNNKRSPPSSPNSNSSRNNSKHHLTVSPMKNLRTSPREEALMAEWLRL